MGEVYNAADTRLGRTVAIKVLPEHLADDPDRLARFHREAQTISSLNHPHICALHDVGDEHGRRFLVMEYVEGETLDNRITAHGRLPLDDALEYATQMADALKAAHDHGIVHRDLKPGNVMITTSGVKLLDFGLAKLSAEATRGADRSSSKARRWMRAPISTRCAWSSTR
jgi:serine/threonine protein kinase